MPVNRGRSRELFERALGYMPGGVSSPVRAFKAVGGDPIIIASGRGSKVTDADGNEYIDYVGAYGPLILGHAHEKVTQAIVSAAERGAAYGATTEMEIDLAQAIVEAIPSVEVVRFVNSGTEAVMSALRLARAFTGRAKIVKFEGCYHGHADGLLVQSGSGLATLGLPDSAGVPPSYAQETIVAPYNDLAAVEDIFRAYQRQIAAVIVEPVAANMGVVAPDGGFLEGLRRLASRAGALLIFDEVITGFRLCYGSVQDVLGVEPDLVCLGKIIGGGLPVGAYGGRREVLSLVAPSGPVYQAGTLSGSPPAMAAGLATLRELSRPGVYSRLEEMASALEEGLAESAGSSASIRINRVGSLLTVFFTGDPVRDYATARVSDTGRYARFFQAMLARKVYLAPSQFEAMFVSLAHDRADIARTIRAADAAFAASGGGS